MTEIELVGIDADDTLWQSETFFAEVEEKFIELMGKYSSDMSLEESLSSNEISNLRVFGYGVKSFTLSMIETAHLVSGGDIASSDIKQIVSWGKELLQHPVILLDGVCGDHNLIFRNIVAKELGVEPESLTLDRSWGFEEWGLSVSDFEKLHEKAVVEHRMFRDMPVIPGASEVLWRLSDQGIWIRIISHRLYVNWGHAIAAGDTADWLDRANIPYRDLCFIGAKSALNADLYIDDGPHNIEAFQNDNKKVIIFDQPYNRHLSGLRAHTWEDVERYVVDAVTEKLGVAEPQLPGLHDATNRIEHRKGQDYE